MAVGSSVAESVKPERGTYRVVHSPSVMVRDRPKGKVVGQQLLGTVVHTDMRSVGGVLGGWVRIKGGYAGGEGWMLVDGTALGLGKLLEAAPRPSLARYRVVHGPHVMVRDRPHGVVVSQRAQGRLLRTDLRTHDGWVRLEEDFYKPGCAEPCEGWVLVHGAHLLPCSHHYLNYLLLGACCTLLVATNRCAAWPRHAARAVGATSLPRRWRCQCR